MKINWMFDQEDQVRVSTKDTELDHQGPSLKLGASRNNTF